MQFGCFSGAFYISLTRITDNRHHPEDVIVGILVGLFFATIILLFLADLFNRPRSFQVKYEHVPDEENVKMKRSETNNVESGENHHRAT